MPLRSHLRVPAPAWRRAGAVAALVAVLGGLATCTVAAQSVPRVGGAPRAEEGIHWRQLKPAQREALKPLEHDWAGIDAQRKQKWLQIADRLPNMPPDERSRVQTRMTEWARMTPEQRGQARMRFEEARQLPAADRRTRWEAYQALSPEEKHQLAARAAARNPAAPASPTHVTPAARVIDGAHADAAQPKSNIVPNPAFAMPPRPVAPTVVQAAPGATTTLITRRPTPPPHQQTGVPKVAATPEFVNRTTLLPKRGPQGAAMRAVPPVDAAAATRR
jgi:hypothetical protein